MKEAYHKTTAERQTANTTEPRQIPAHYSNRVQAEGFRVMRSAHATQDRVYPRAVPYIYSSAGARAVPSDVGPRWRPGGAAPRAGEAEPNALGALARHAEECERYEAEEGRGRRRAA